jgi:DNA-binding MarR family transcriptional regulator
LSSGAALGPTGGDLPPLLGALLRMPYQAMMGEVVEPGLAAAGHGAVRPTHFPIVQTLSRHPSGLRATDLAERARVTKQSMGALIDHLEAHGYVERVPDPDDGRARLTRLTDRGWDFVTTVRRLVERVEAEWVGLVGAERVAQLRGLLTELVEALGARPVRTELVPGDRRPPELGQREPVGSTRDVAARGVLRAPGGRGAAARRLTGDGDRARLEL